MKLKFYIALWASKLASFIFKLRGNEQDDRPGILIYKICDDFLKYVAKPKITVAVTGTNGKSTVSSLITDILREQGYTVSYNEWGANLKAGHCFLMSRSVNLFNKPIVDAAVLEVDEKTSCENMSKLQPDYFIVTNICRDSMRRNGHPLYIKQCIQNTLDSLEDTVVILDADDPVSGFLKPKEGKGVYFGIDKEQTEPIPNYNIQDFTVCPVCHKKPEYIHHHYLHVGKVHCPNCGLVSPDADYEGFDFNPQNRTLAVREKDGDFTYNLGSSSVFNAFNYMAVISYFRSRGMSKEDLAGYLNKVSLPASRETKTTVNGIEIFTNMCKGQTGSSASVVFEYLSKEDANIEIVLLVNEEYWDIDGNETITWLYDVDYELLRSDNIKKIIIGGPIYADYKLRFKMAGLPDEKIVCIEDEDKLIDYVTFDGIDRIYVLHEVNCVTKGRKFKEAVEKKLKGEL